MLLRKQLRNKKFFNTIVFALLTLTVHCATAKVNELGQNQFTKHFELPLSLFEAFADIYETELGSVDSCDDGVGFYEYKVCSKALKNEGNAPYILFSKGKLDANGVRQKAPFVVLLHGLSDSPFYVRGIAEHLNKKGYTVVAPLTPGHGKINAIDDMRDPMLKQRWYKHLDAIMELIKPYSDTRFIGGFSTGGTLATRYTLLNSDEVDGLLLFSAALALSNSAENLGRIWGMKWIAKIVDGEHISEGPNPYRYPKVAGFAGLNLIDAIFEVREMLQDTEVSVPIFAAHSLSDIVTPYNGVRDLLLQIKGNHQTFSIDESYDVCHQDLVISSMMMVDLKIDKSKLNINEKCVLVKPNPMFLQMMAMLDYFLENN